MHPGSTCVYVTLVCAEDSGDPPNEYVAVLEECWSGNPALRPSFASIVNRLQPESS
eukprot:m.1236137 g.1236137  ORF g.1236137 m.1236137 type:complete len:56 (-) comp24665_c0_seq139:129-296(-)